MENVETYLHRLSFTGNTLHQRVVHLFYRLYKLCESHYSNLLRFFQTFIAPYTPHNLNKSQTLRNLNELRDLLHRRYHFYDLRVNNPHQQVLRLSVNESKSVFGGAVSYLPVVLDILDQTRVLMFHTIESTVRMLDPSCENDSRQTMDPTYMI